MPNDFSDLLRHSSNPSAFIDSNTQKYLAQVFISYSVSSLLQKKITNSSFSI